MTSTWESMTSSASSHLTD